MKYITTSKNPIFKEGINFESEGHSFISIRFNSGDTKDFEISHLLKHGYIKEVQEPEFTKDDMIEFVKYLYDYYDQSSGMEYLNGQFNNWLNQRK